VEECVEKEQRAGKIIHFTNEVSYPKTGDRQLIMVVLFGHFLIGIVKNFLKFCYPNTIFKQDHYVI